MIWLLLEAFSTSYMASTRGARIRAVIAGVCRKHPYIDCLSSLLDSTGILSVPAGPRPFSCCLASYLRQPCIPLSVAVATCVLHTASSAHDLFGELLRKLKPNTRRQRAQPHYIPTQARFQIYPHSSKVSTGVRILDSFSFRS